MANGAMKATEIRFCFLPTFEVPPLKTKGEFESKLKRDIRAGIDKNNAYRDITLERDFILGKSQPLGRDQLFEGRFSTSGKMSRAPRKSTEGGGYTLGRKFSRFTKKSINDYGRDDVFLPNRDFNRHNQGFMAKQRVDSTGFILPGDQWKKSYRENKAKESEYAKLFIYNVPVSYSEHDLYISIYSQRI